MTDEPAIEAIGLEKSYGDVRVLDGVDLRVARGSVFALLGPNGAGKTTTVRILATLTRADAGSARVAGLDVVADRAPVRPRDQPHRPVRRGRRAADRRGEPAHDGPAGRPRPAPRPGARAGELLERFDLADAGRRRVGDLLRRHAPAPRPRREPRRRARR